MKELSDILLSQLGKRAKAGERIRGIVAKALPHPLADALLYARVERDCLILTVDTPGAATRMRFCQRDLIAACAAVDMQPKSVTFKVSPRSTCADVQRLTVSAECNAHKPSISKASADHINTFAEGVTSDRLKLALQRLAKRRQRH